MFTKPAAIAWSLCGAVLAVVLCAAGVHGRKHGGTREGSVSDERPAQEKGHRPSGRFSGAPVGYVGRLILELTADGSYALINLVSIHLPPVELENRRGTVTWTGDKGCLDPAPAAIEPCFTAQGHDALVVVQKKDRKPITLQRIVETAR